MFESTVILIQKAYDPLIQDVVFYPILLPKKWMMGSIMTDKNRQKSYKPPIIRLSSHLISSRSSFFISHLPPSYQKHHKRSSVSPSARAPASGSDPGPGSGPGSDPWSLPLSLGARQQDVVRSELQGGDGRLECFVGS